MNPVMWVVGGVVFAVAIILWRLRPMLAGRLRPKDDLVTRVHKWNKYVAPLFRKTMSDNSLQVANGAAFLDAATGVHKAMATWTMSPCVIPDVDFIVIASPETGEGGTTELLGALPFSALRDLLPGNIQRQSMWGHVMWVSVWPGETDLDRISTALTPIDSFRKRHATQTSP